MKLGILGHFCIGFNRFDGQTIKTQNLADGIEKYSDNYVMKIDTYAWKKNPIRLVKQIKIAFKECESIVMLPAHNGVRVFTPILLYFKKKYNKKIFYDVIGGWLPEFLKDKKGLARNLKSFDGIWVETSTMKKKLEALGFTNVVVVPNFKELEVLTPTELTYLDNEPYRLCTFSRVMKEKGIEDAIDSVRFVNEQCGKIIYTLDIYGQVDSEQLSWFEELKISFPDYVKYRGTVPGEKSVEVLQNYFALLFPTRFYTEGIPGTIIDAYAAGVPVISARWENFSDVIDDGITGVGYDFFDVEKLKTLLLSFIMDPSTINDMKIACIQKAQKYTTKVVIDILIKGLKVKEK